MRSEWHGIWHLLYDGLGPAVADKFNRGGLSGVFGKVRSRLRHTQPRNRRST